MPETELDVFELHSICAACLFGYIWGYRQSDLPNPYKEENANKRIAWDFGNEEGKTQRKFDEWAAQNINDVPVKKEIE